MMTLYLPHTCLPPYRHLPPPPGCWLGFSAAFVRLLVGCRCSCTTTTYILPPLTCCRCWLILVGLHLRLRADGFYPVGSFFLPVPLYRTALLPRIRLPPYLAACYFCTPLTPPRALPACHLTWYCLLLLFHIRFLPFASCRAYLPLHMHHAAWAFALPHRCWFAPRTRLRAFARF